jgi:hypothetical protein
MLTGMRISLRSKKAPTSSPACCTEDLAHCHGTLVLHADGTVECDDQATCAGDELQHELWVACHELRCGCAGDEAPLDGWLLAA